MATLSFTVAVPDAKQAEIVDAVARNTGWNPDSADTRNEHVRKRVAQWIKDNYRAYKANLDADAARASAVVSADGVSIA